MIFLVSTPIGNLGDITLRALETLKAVDLILCEDTRTSLPLLNHYSIDKPLKSFHKFNEKKAEQEIVQLLESGKKIALISDAGTPSISDPGAGLIKVCREKGFHYTVIPGVSAPIAALTLSGLPSERFQFIGFLPKKEAERKHTLIQALHYPGITIAFETPSRIDKTLAQIDTLSDAHEIALCREITKKYEEVLFGPASSLKEHLIKGELVLLIPGGKSYTYDLSPKEHVALLQEEFDLTKQEALKLAATLRGVTKREIYF